MMELRGKYNECRIFTNNVDKETISQVKTLLDQEFVKESKIRIMPDTHAGKGCVIGTTMTITDKVCPNLVGVDIGCGMLAAKLKRTPHADLEELDGIVRKYIPSGFDVHEVPVYSSNADKIKAPVDVERAMRSLGTLGGGNHFVELNVDKDGFLWLVVHTGSRHLGVEVCKHYQKKAEKSLLGNKKEKEELIKRLKSEGREREIQEAVKNLKMDKIPKDLCYVEGKDLADYLHDMKIAQEHAFLNRCVIIKTIVEKMGWQISEWMDTKHNYIDTEWMDTKHNYTGEKILRKGAVSAEKGEKLIIPMNMRDGSLICIGKGKCEWNFSAPHGAGRILSRGKAREVIPMEEYEKSMKGIYTTCVNESTLDESPMAYKPMAEIMENIKDTVDVIDVIKPLYNFKAN